MENPHEDSFSNFLRKIIEGEKSERHLPKLIVGRDNRVYQIIPFILAPRVSKVRQIYSLDRFNNVQPYSLNIENFDPYSDDDLEAAVSAIEISEEIVYGEKRLAVRVDPTDSYNEIVFQDGRVFVCLKDKVKTVKNFDQNYTDTLLIDVEQETTTLVDNEDLLFESIAAKKNVGFYIGFKTADGELKPNNEMTSLFMRNAGK